MSSLNQTILETYATRFPVELAKRLEKRTDQILELSPLTGSALMRVLDCLDHWALRETFLQLPSEKQTEVLAASSVRLTMAILRSLSDEESETVLAQLGSTEREELNKLMTFPEDTAGHYMDKVVARFNHSDTVEQALEKLTGTHHRARSIYVVDENNMLKGRVDVQDMALADKQTLLSKLMIGAIETVTLVSPRSELLEIFDRSRVDSIPIVDQEFKLMGVVRYASLFQAATDEATADMQTMVGASADERALSTPWFAVKKRLPWLHINLLTAFLAAAVVGLFESTIAQFTALAILLPVVAGQSGNAGSQALAVTMRGLALKEISALEWRKVLSKEVQVGIIDGFALALTCGFGVFLWSSSFGLALVIAIAMVTAMIAAGMSGALVPILLVRLGQDPATASSIILTTVTDVAGFTSFLGTATLLSFML